MAVVHLGNLAHNVRQLRAHLQPQVQMMASIKADAYGHGAVACARTLLAAGVARFGVATVAEGAELRASGIEAPILVYGAPVPQALRAAVATRLEMTVFTEQHVRDIDDVAAQVGLTAQVHVDVDTGMGRLGAVGTDAALRVLQAAARAERVRVVGTYTHMACADEALVDGVALYSRMQLQRFTAVIDSARAAGLDTGLLHMANSAGLMLGPAFQWDIVRPGIGLYGYDPAPGRLGGLDLRPVLHLFSAVVRSQRLEAGSGISYGAVYRATGDEWIATLPVGYADGIPRAAAGHLRVRLLEDGASAAVVGRVCMDHLMIAVRARPCRTSEWVMLYGGARGQSASLGDVAEALDTIPYELLCRLSARVERVHLDGWRDDRELDVFLRDAL